MACRHQPPTTLTSRNVAEDVAHLATQRTSFTLHSRPTCIQLGLLWSCTQHASGCLPRRTTRRRLLAPSGCLRGTVRLSRSSVLEWLSHLLRKTQEPSQCQDDINKIPTPLTFLHNAASRAMRFSLSTQQKPRAKMASTVSVSPFRLVRQHQMAPAQLRPITASVTRAKPFSALIK